jgi:hypothetical protein
MAPTGCIRFVLQAVMLSHEEDPEVSLDPVSTLICEQNKKSLEIIKAAVSRNLILHFSGVRAILNPEVDLDASAPLVILRHVCASTSGKNSLLRYSGIISHTR